LEFVHYAFIVDTYIHIDKHSCRSAQFLQQGSVNLCICATLRRRTLQWLVLSHMIWLHIKHGASFSW